MVEIKKQWTIQTFCTAVLQYHTMVPMYKIWQQCIRKVEPPIMLTWNMITYDLMLAKVRSGFRTGSWLWSCPILAACWTWWGCVRNSGTELPQLVHLRSNQKVRITNNLELADRQEIMNEQILDHHWVQQQDAAKARLPSPLKMEPERDSRPRHWHSLKVVTTDRSFVSS